MHKFVPWLLIGALYCRVAGAVLQFIALAMLIFGNSTNC